MDHRELERLSLEEDQVRDRDLERDDALHEHAGDEGLEVRELLAERDEERQKLVILAIKALFEKKTVTVSQLGLPEQQTVALEALQSAITSRHTTGEFVYADDRRTLLEQALAILQPTLTGAAPELLAELGSMEKLTDKVASLRAKLDKLEDAQEAIPEWEKHEWFGEEGGEAGDTDDKPVEITEPEEVGSRESMLSDGKDVVREEAPSTLAGGGPEAPSRPEVSPSSLSSGGQAVAIADVPSTLVDGGPAAAARVPGPSTLGDGIRDEDAGEDDAPFAAEVAPRDAAPQSRIGRLVRAAADLVSGKPAPIKPRGGRRG